MSKQRFTVNDRQLPFKLSAQSRGVQKAYGRFVQQYGLTRGRQIFLDHARERGTGNTIRQRVDSVYTTGRRLKP